MNDEAALEIRPPTEAELDDVFHVLNQAFDDWPGLGPDIEPREHLTWRCHSSPTSMDHHIVAVHEGEVGGVMLRVDRGIKLGDEVLPAQSGGDSSLITRLQGRGLFRGIRQYSFDNARERGVALHLAFTRHPAVVHLQTGGVLVPRNRLALLLKPLGGIRGATATKGRTVTSLAIRAMALTNRLRYGRSKPPAGKALVETVEEFDASVNALWESGSGDFDFIPVRDRDYLNWRYCDPRGGKFTVRAVGSDDGMEGYSVLKLVGGRAYIVDLLARSGRVDVVEQLVWDAEQVARQSGADGIVCQLPDGHTYTRSLLRAGFLNTRRKADFNIVPLSVDAKKLDFLAHKDARIHVTLGDSDLI